MSLQAYDGRFRRDIFIYNIGLASTGILGSQELIGALVDGSAVGDTSWIRSVARTDVEIEPDTLFYAAETEITVFNPRSDRVRITRLGITPRTGYAWFFEIHSGDTVEQVELNSVTNPEQEIDVSIAPSDAATLRVIDLDPCIAVGVRDAVKTGSNKKEGSR